MRFVVMGVSAALAVAWALPAEADCTCRAGGRDYDLGQTICLKSPQGGRLARCEMALNNTSWRVIGEACPSADLQTTVPRLAAASDSHAHRSH